MPKTETKYASKKPYSAEILIRQESHVLTTIKEDGYTGGRVEIEGGILLKTTLAADTLEGLTAKIAGHVALVE